MHWGSGELSLLDMIGVDALLAWLLPSGLIGAPDWYPLTAI
jgi:hypothetical protein